MGGFPPPEKAADWLAVVRARALFLSFLPNMHREAEAETVDFWCFTHMTSSQRERREKSIYIQMFLALWNKEQRIRNREQRKKKDQRT